MDFESALSQPIPLAEAAAFFLRLKTAADPVGAAPPDETGQLEGQFAAPVEQVLKLMTEMVENELKTMYAYKAYANSLRDLSHFGIAKEFEEHADNELEHADFLLRRMAVIGGPVELTDIPAPPATTDPNVILETMIRMEQEGIEKWRALHEILGDNPTRYKVEEYLTRELEHLDELWQLRPYQGGAQPTAMMSREPAAPPPMTEAPPGVDAAPKMAQATMGADTPMLPPTAKGQNAISLNTAPLPPTAQGQHQKLALALKGFSDMQRQAITKGLGQVEKGLVKKPVGVLRQIAPDLKSLAERPSASRIKAASALKLALEQTGLGTGAPFQQYVEAEQGAQVGQEANELAFYRQRMQQAMAQLEQQKTELEQTQGTVQQLQQQVQTTQDQQSQYQQMVSDATQNAVSSRDDVLREQQASAAMRMAYQKLRGDLLNVASQEPPSTEMLAEQAAMTSGPPPTTGPAGQAPDPGTAPNAAAPAPASDGAPSQPASGQDPAMSQAQPATQSGQKEPGEQKVASVLDRVPHALAGAALGAGAESLYAKKSNQPLREKVDRLGQVPERSFGQAMDLAQAKARLALGEAVEEHPKAALLSGALMGAAEGAISGPDIVNKVRRGVGNLKALRAG
jgi:bacterioferritin